MEVEDGNTFSQVLSTQHYLSTEQLSPTAHVGVQQVGVISLKLKGLCRSLTFSSRIIGLSVCFKEERSNLL